jgi:hypothetical protein
MLMLLCDGRSCIHTYIYLYVIGVRIYILKASLDITLINKTLNCARFINV